MKPGLPKGHACGSQASAEQPSLRDPGRWNFYPVSLQPASAGELLRAVFTSARQTATEGLLSPSGPQRMRWAGRPDQQQCFQTSNMKAVGALHGW